MGLRQAIGRHRLAAGMVVATGMALAVFVLVWFEPQSALVNKRVDESLPGVEAAPPSTGEEAPASGAETVDKPEEPKGPVIVAKGKFDGIEHGTSGTALLVELPDGSAILRFEDLQTLNGPELKVYLSRPKASADPSTFDDEFVDLGDLKGNQGNQNYDIPGNVDIGRYRSAVIWCKRFSVGFGVAPLDAA